MKKINILLSLALIVSACGSFAKIVENTMLKPIVVEKEITTEFITPEKTIEVEVVKEPVIMEPATKEALNKEFENKRPMSKRPMLKEITIKKTMNNRPMNGQGMGMGMGMGRARGMMHRCEYCKCCPCKYGMVKSPMGMRKQLVAEKTIVIKNSMNRPLRVKQIISDLNIKPEVRAKYIAYAKKKIKREITKHELAKKIIKKYIREDLYKGTPKKEWAPLYADYTKEVQIALPGKGYGEIVIEKIVKAPK